MVDSSSRNPHDEFFKAMFSRLEVARPFVENFLPADVVACLDLDSLQQQPGSFVDAGLSEVFSDLLFSVESRSSHGESPNSLVYLLFEHKSSPDSQVAFQLLKYVVRILEQRQRDGLPLCCVIPIVVYHGSRTWSEMPTIADQIDCDEALKRFIPRLELAAYDLSRYSDDELRRRSLLQAALLLLKYTDRDGLADRLIEVLELISKIKKGRDGLECVQMVLRYVVGSSERISRDQLLEIVQTRVTEKGKSIMPTIAEQWVQEGRVEGLEKGLEQGLEKGLEKGQLIGRIRAFEELLGIATSEVAVLESQTLTALAELAEDLKRRMSK